MHPLLTELLGLPGVEIKQYAALGNELMLQVEAQTQEATCPRCGQVSRHRHQNHRYLVRDLSMSGRTVFLRVNRRQFKCETCGKPFSESLDFIGMRRRHTHRFMEWITNQVVHSDVHNVAVQNQLTDEEVCSIIKYIGKKRIKIDVSKLKRLGIDEIALRKGQKNFVVVLVDLDRKIPIGLVESRKQEEIEKVLKGWGKEVLEQIKEVSIDLCESYESLVKKLMPDAEIVADRFHVMKLVNEELNKERNKVIKANEENENEEERERVKEAMKQSKYALLKAEENLTERQKEKLKDIREVVPELGEMHRQKEEFRKIFEEVESWGKGALRLLDWLVEANERFKKSVGTICRWFGEVSGYFEKVKTNMTPDTSRKTALICGISGQDGAYLAQLLLNLGYEVIGTSRDAQVSSFRNLIRLGIRDQVKLMSMALNDFRSVLQVLSKVQPDEVYNLAGQTSVGLSFDQPVETFESITMATLNVLEVIRFLGYPIRFYNACSTECFGNTPTWIANERTPFNPRSPYAVAKSAAFWQVANYREAYHLFACSGILSNHESPLRPQRFVTQKIIAAAWMIANGDPIKLHLGNIDIQRDWGWAPEYVAAMHKMLQQDQPDDYVVATGETHRLQDFVETTFAYLDLDWRDHVILDQSLLRPTDIAISRVDPTKARQQLGWIPHYRMEDVVKMMLEAKQSEFNRSE